jgi:hypothetical protein
MSINVQKSQSEMIQEAIEKSLFAHVETRVLLSNACSTKIDFLRCSFMEISLPYSPSKVQGGIHKPWVIIHESQDQEST